MRFNVIFFSSALFLMMAGCGDDSVTEITEVNKLSVEIVSKVKDLPKCNSDQEGRQIWVKSEEAMYSCIDGKWKNFSANGTPSQNSITCSTETLDDASGIKVLCDGDSIGVLQNKVSADLPECEMNLMASDSLKIQCGSVSKLLSISDLTSSFDGNYEVVLDSEQVAVRLESVGGFSQKGPFLTGSEVVAYELENGRTLNLTGNLFRGRISSDDGYFDIRTVKLSSQYAMVSASGFYLNEITGKVSDSKITLSALTDLRNRNTVNVNVLTHMEYERILHLVSKEKYSFTKAKRKAEQEIFDLFHIDGSSFFEQAEDMNVGGSSAGDAALLAISILLQRNQTSGGMLSLVTDIGNDIAKTGRWENDSIKTVMADWIMTVDSAGYLGLIKQNVANWGLGTKVADFEPYVRNFWFIELGLDSCTQKLDGKQAFVDNDLSKHSRKKGAYTSFVCNAKESRWIVQTEDEKNVFGWKDTLDGVVRDGKVNSTIKYVFDSTGALNGLKGWRRALDVESELGGCRANLYGDTLLWEAFSQKYRCDETSHLWTRVYSYVDIDVSKWPKNTDGDAKWVKTSTGEKICVVYDDLWEGWRKGYDSDCNLGFMGCSAARVNEFAYSAETGRYYRCSKNYSVNVVAQTESLDSREACYEFCVQSLPKRGEWEELYDWYYESNSMGNFCELYQVFGSSWEVASTRGADTYGLECKGRTFVTGLVNPENLYVCFNGTLSLMTETEKKLMLDCNSGNYGKYTDDGLYVCSFKSGVGYDWELASSLNATKNYFNEDLTYGKLVDSRDNKEYRTIFIEGSGTWMAENLNFRNEDDFYHLRNQVGCGGINYIYDMGTDNADTTRCSTFGAIYSWTGAMNIDSKWNSESAQKIDGLIKDPHQGICPDGWHIPSQSEWLELLGQMKSNSSKVDENTFTAIDLLTGDFESWHNGPNASGFTLIPIRLGDGIASEARIVLTSSVVYVYQTGNMSYQSRVDFYNASLKGSVRCKKDESK